MLSETVAIPSRGWDSNQPVKRRSMGAASRHRWSSFVRLGLVEEALGRLKSHGTYGVAIIGPAGVGKSMLSRRVKHALSPDTYVLQLLGSPGDAVVAYGAIDLLMARLPPLAVESPTAIIQGVTEFIRDEAGGREILVLIDELPSIDSASVGVLMHLLLSGMAKVMVMVRSISELPDDFLWLLNDGLLVERRLENFSRVEVAQLLSAGLGGCVSAAAASALFVASQGNPLVLHALVEEHVASGNLTANHGTWVVRDDIHLDPESALSGLVRMRLVREPDQISEALRKLAFIQRAPLQLVEAVLGEETVAQLERLGYLSIQGDAKLTAEFAEPHVGEAIRGWLSTAEKELVFQAISEIMVPDLDTSSTPELMRFAAWATEGGFPLKAEFALAACKNAAYECNPRLALRLSEGFTRDEPLWLELLIVRSAAYRALADYSRSLEEIEQISPEYLTQLSCEDFVAWSCAMTAALVWVKGGIERIPTIIGNAQGRISAETEHQTIQIALSKRLALTRFLYASHVGEFACVLAELEAGYQQNEDQDYRLNCGAFLSLAWTITGREIEAIDVARAVMGEARQRQLLLTAPDTAFLALVLAQMWTGQWRESIAAVDEVFANLPMVAHYAGGALELLHGLALIYAGKGKEAREVLQAAAAQLEVRDTFGASVVVDAAMAFANAQVGDVIETQKFLSLVAEPRHSTTWVFAAAARFCQLMAMRWIERPHAAELLAEAAREDLVKNRITTASIALFGATVDGSPDDFLLLEQTSLRRQGPMATLNATVANACRNKSAAKALRAAAMARELELDAVESRCMVLAIEFAQAAGDTRTVHQTRRDLHQLADTLPALPLAAPVITTTLTQRELQVAKLASKGMGNKTIADRIGVSVRTVEGHLYQVFAKFGITSRVELEQLEGF